MAFNFAAAALARRRRGGERGLQRHRRRRPPVRGHHWGAAWPAVTDPGGSVANAYGVGSPPETFLIDPRGTVVGAARTGHGDQLDQAWPPRLWPRGPGTGRCLSAGAGPLARAGRPGGRARGRPGRGQRGGLGGRAHAGRARRRRWPRQIRCPSCEDLSVAQSSASAASPCATRSAPWWPRGAATSRSSTPWWPSTGRPSSCARRPAG